MTHVFLSYAKIDTRPVVERLAKVLSAQEGITVWWDESLEPAHSWALQIQHEIDRADYVVVLLSPDVNRPETPERARSFVLNEIDYAQEQRKTIIPVMAQKTKTPVQIAGIQYIDLVANESIGIQRLLRRLGLASEPVEAPRAMGSMAGDLLDPKPERSQAWLWVSLAVVLVLVVIVVLVVSRPSKPDEVAVLVSETPDRLATSRALEQGQTAVAEVIQQQMLELMLSEMPTSTSSASATPTSSATPTPEPTSPPLNETQVEATIRAEIVTIEAERRNTQEAIASATAFEGTRIALSWTPTPMPDTRATALARVQEQETATQNSMNATATATLWTKTLIASFTPSSTPTPTSTPTATAILTPLEAALQRALTPVSQNSAWTPFEQEFGRISYVLVPAGCFQMGSNDGENDEQPVHEQCFDTSFWILKTEVTNAQFGSVGCSQWSSEPNQPRNCVTWFQARDHCVSIGGRLSTEAEWEYAARGEESWVYPWGNAYNLSVVIGRYDSIYGNKKPAPVGSRPMGASWVGALDMSGNVREWTSSFYEPYPYVAEDGREADTRDKIDTRRVLRGGSFGSNLTSLRGAVRNSNTPDNYNYVVGFRCVRDSAP